MNAIFCPTLFRSHALYDKPLAVAPLDRVIVTANRRNVNNHVGLYHSHPGGCMARCPCIGDHDMFIGFSAVHPKACGIVAQCFRIPFACLLDSVRNDAAEEQNVQHKIACFALPFICLEMKMISPHSYPSWHPHPFHSKRLQGFVCEEVNMAENCFHYHGPRLQTDCVDQSIDAFPKREFALTGSRSGCPHPRPARMGVAASAKNQNQQNQGHP
jgi:hypothetical protein